MMAYFRKLYGDPRSIGWTENEVRETIKANGVHSPGGQFYVRKPHQTHRQLSTLPCTSDGTVTQFVGANQQLVVTMSKAQDAGSARQEWKDAKEDDGPGRCSDDEEDGDNSSGSSGIVCGSARVISAGGFETPSALRGRPPPPPFVGAPAKRARTALNSIAAAAQKSEEDQKRDAAEL